MNFEHKSIWQLQAFPEFGPLPGDIHADAAIVGAGICGLLCAYFLHLEGIRDIAVIDAGEICGGVTARTTAKITSQHGLIYSKLSKGLSSDKAARYLAANEDAIRLYRDLIRTERIDCDLTEANAWVYAASPKDVKKVEQEAENVRKLGVHALLETETELPFPTLRAVGFPGQAHFHPLKFAARICEILSGAGCKFYTSTAATGIEKCDGVKSTVRTGRGRVHARYIISASHYPFVDKPGLMFTKVFQNRSYVLALKNVKPIKDMYIDCADGGFTLRPYHQTGNGNLILLGAYEHKSGHDGRTLHFEGLAKSALRLFPGCEVAATWSAQDCMTHDGIPCIGRYQGMGDNVYVATGFNKWGMTSAMAAARLISDLITRGDSEYRDVFCPQRMDIGLSAASFVKESADIAGSFLTHMTMAGRSLDSLNVGEGGIVEINGKRVGVYRDLHDRLYAIKPVCTHMGCSVKWNRDENTWDCACHGSWFDYMGNVIGGPAMKALEGVKLKQPDYAGAKPDANIGGGS